jgi:hypothetical protein
VNSAPARLSPIPTCGPGSSARRNRGRKQRPVCVVVAIRNAAGGNTHLALLVITTQPQQTRRIALEIPEIERKRAGLSDLKHCWIMVDEYNYDIVERSWYMSPIRTLLGRFSKPFMVKTARLFAEARGRTGRVNRLD